MKIKILSDEGQINNFLEKSATSAGMEFLCSKKWQDIFGSKMEIFGLFADNKLITLFNLSKKNLFASKSYYYLPRGPIFLNDDYNNQVNWDFILNYLKEKKAVFCRVEPVKIVSNSQFSFLKSIDLQPAQTLILGLESLSIEELRKNLHQKTRYNIKLAAKKGVVVREAETEADFLDFWNLMNKTGARDGFRIHDQAHYKLLVDNGGRFVRLFLATFDDKTIAAGIFVFYGDKVTYLHGASDHDYRQLMAPYLLQWELISLAKKEGFKYYDFFGIDEKKWPGVTRFKLGFSGYRFSYAGTYDVVLNKKIYLIYRLLRKLKRLF